MPLFELGREALTPLPRTTFADRRVLERDDLQRLLRDQIDVVVDDVMVVAEEYGAFADSRRRIDLLGLDRQGRLVVIELKRTEDGGHIELQALRYAAMVSAMTFDNLVDAHEVYLSQQGRDVAGGRAELLRWMGVTADEAILSKDVRILLVSANFDTEITTTVLWLNTFDRMDIRCVRMVPYLLDDRLVLDVQQLVPLAEAGDYQIRIREKEIESRAVGARAADGRDWTAYVITSPNGTSEPLRKRRAVLRMIHELHNAGVVCEQLTAVLPLSRFAPIDGELQGSELADAFVRHYRGVAPGWWFLGEGEPIVEQGRTWVLSKRWNRHTVEQALGDLAALAPSGAFGFAAQVADIADGAEDSA